MVRCMVRMATGQTLAGAAALLLAVLVCPGVEGCGWTTTALSGTVQSPNFPNNYPNDQNCVYVITAPANHRVILTFTDFALENEDNCPYDYVLIRDGGETSPVIARLCGTSLPKTRTTFGNQMWINFVSDGSETMRGFEAVFTTDVQAPFFLATSSLPSSDVGGNIHRIDVDTVSNYRVPMDEALYLPVAVDYDIVEHTIYWTEVGLRKGIRGASINGGDIHTVHDTGDDSTLDGLAVDPASRLIFYTDTGRSLIAMVTISTFAHRTIINTDLDKPRAIVLDIADGVMFWTDWGTYPKIERANYDGTDRRTLISTNLKHVNGLALDVQNNYLYWVDSGTDRVERSDMEGQNRVTLLSLTSGSHHFFGLVRLDDYLYITDWITGGATTSSYIRRLSLLNRNFTDYGVTSGRRLNDIHVYDPRRPSSESVNGCGNNNGGCDSICIPLPGNSSKCTCPDGQTLASDQRSCVGGTDTTTTPDTGSFAVAVTTTDPQPLETNGNSQMTLTCNPDPAVTVSSYAWSVSCTIQVGNTCVFQPRAPEDDGKRVTCTVSSSDGRVASGGLMIQLNYPPQEPPIIQGYSRDTVYQAGDALTLTCTVHGGKPLVTSVHFACGTHQDADDSFGSTYVRSHLFINPLRREDDRVTCFCTARWKDTDWYKLSATETLRVTGIPPKSEVDVVPIAVGCSVFVIFLVAVIIAVVCIVKKGWCRPRPKPAQNIMLDDHNYCSLGTLQRPAAQQPGQPFVVNAAYEQDPNPCMNPEMGDNAINSIYDTLDNAMAIDSDPADDYLKPVAGSDQKPPVRCSWDKQPSPHTSYIHAVSNPSHNDYVPFRLPQGN